MNNIKQFVKNISPFNNREEMPGILYIVKVILIFFVFKFGSEVIGEIFALAIHFACGKNPLQGELFDMNTITLITYFGYSLMIGVVMLFWKLFQKKTVAELGFTKKAGSYFTGILIGTALLAFCVFPVILTGSLKYNGVFSDIDTKMVLLMIPCFVFQGAMEEVLTRGVVQQLLVRKTSVPVAFALSALLFTYPHIGKMSGDPAVIAVAIVNLVLISLLFSLITYRFGSIWAACGLHSAWNYILCNIMGLNLSGNGDPVASVFDIRTSGSSILNGADYGIEASIITTAVLSLALVLCIVISRIKSLKKEKAKIAINIQSRA